MQVNTLCKEQGEIGGVFAEMQSWKHWLFSIEESCAQNSVFGNNYHWIQQEVIAQTCISSIRSPEKLLLVFRDFVSRLVNGFPNLGYSSSDIVWWTFKMYSSYSSQSWGWQRTHTVGFTHKHFAPRLLSCKINQPAKPIHQPILEYWRHTGIGVYMSNFKSQKPVKTKNLLNLNNFLLLKVSFFEIWCNQKMGYFLTPVQ